jgi:isochorismate hydrolase
MASLTSAKGFISKGLRLDRSRAALFVCDIQDRFRPLIHRSETVIHKSALLCKAAKAMQIPCVVTEQYPKALGHTVPDLGIDLTTTKVFEKKQFSMMTPEVWENFRAMNRNQAILCGIEAHVCITQTALDLMQEGIEVFLIADAVSSQRPFDRSCGIRRLSKEGAIIESTEMAIMELMQSANTDGFKGISQMLKENNKLENEFKDDTSIF